MFIGVPSALSELPVKEIEIKPEIKTEECSCVKYARSLGTNLPFGVDAKWYTTFPKVPPQVSAVAIFKYGEDVNKYHLAYVYKIEENGFWVDERLTIKGECVTRQRFVDWIDKFLVGFWTNN